VYRNAFPTVSICNENSFELTPLAQALGWAAMSMTLAVSASGQEVMRELPKLVAQDLEEVTSPKVDELSSPKVTEPLINIPQTMTVVPQLVLQQQGARTLTDALRNTPGITMQLGENGRTSAGDAFSIRGTAAESNIFVDSIRDLGAITRDTFNTEQVEIAKGAVGADNGRGTIAGYVNMVSKQAQLDEFRSASLGVNTAGNFRVTADMNTTLSDTSALRASVMWQRGGVPGRDYVENNRWGVAPAFAFGLDTPIRVYVFTQHLRTDNVPDGGIPSIGYAGFYNASLTNGTAAPVNIHNFYGRYDDFERIKSDMATLRIEHDVSDDLKLNNSTRYGHSSMDRVMTGINALTVSSTTNRDVWTVARTRQTTFQNNDILTNQTNLRINMNTGVIRHEITSGLEFIREGQTTMGWNGYGTLPAYLNGGTAINLPDANLYNPDAHFSYNYYAPFRTGADSDGQTDTYAAYAFDTLKFGERWLMDAGVRFERYLTEYNGVSVNNTTGATTVTDVAKRGGLLSWKTGVVFKPRPNGSVYASLSNACTPPGSSNFTLSSEAETNINNISLDPQKATNYEVGTKWDVLAERLSLNAALYRTDNRNQLVQLDSGTNAFVQYGERRVQGIELGLVGKITDAWQVTAGASWSDNEELQGAVTTSSNAGVQDTAGSTARWAPEYSANLWTAYSLARWSAGLGMTWQSEQKRVTRTDIDTNTVDGLKGIPGYTVFDGMLAYALGSNINLQLNVYNLLDKTYISSLNNGGSRLRLGAPRYAQVTATVKF
jgi:catecholate siderophore receptor